MFENLKNQRFERLVAVRREGKKWLCACDCGNEKFALPSNLKQGLTKSCGCLNREVTAARNRVDKRTHGRTSTPEYRAWTSMHQRCSNQRDKSFRNYGGRGIAVGAEWSTFEQFYTDMGERPSALHSVEREDVNGGYCAENCKWAIALEQQRNKRSNLRVSAFGRTGPLSTFISDAHSAEYQRARKEFHRGVPPEKALAKCR